MHTTLRNLLIAAFTLISLGAYALDIKGVVVDTEGEPMIAATIRLLKSDSTFVKGTKTNAGSLIFLTLRHR